MKSNKTLFYPFDYHSYPLIHYLNKTRNDIVVAADAGSSLINRDISYAINSTQFENLKVHDIKEVCMRDKITYQEPKAIKITLPDNFGYKYDGYDAFHEWVLTTDSLSIDSLKKEIAKKGNKECLCKALEWGLEVND